ncbi:hypothetical protein Glove_718g24 [Diversispora epigaea]|uniref:Lysosomal dipeptide transporter MFSD1 n=1 Tax=Diversispora epigaea TaxID=1348612 RepID=A0A397G1K6_9GLOM|nr:hypothetical protein Glove_718g24 [Diversispora epigaea]
MEQTGLSNVINITEESEETEEAEEADESDEDLDFLPSFSQPSLSNLDSKSENSSYALEDRELLIKNNHSNSTHKESDSSAISNMNNMGNSNPGGSRKVVDNSEKILKMCAMACACTFGVGSHFSSHIIGPMKGILMERLDLTNTQFSLLVASLTLCNTVIPIVSGLLVARFGTTRSSLVITTVILVGMIIVSAASWTGKVGLMIVGFMVFGVGFAPLTIVQETIIVQFFHGSGLGFALAVGLTLGRLSSFIATVLAVPLSMMPPLTYRTPFIAATFTCFVSWVMNFVYIILLKQADNRKNHNKGGVALLQVVEKKKVHWNAIFDLSDLFWWSLVVGLLCGSVLSPFVHLSSNIIKHRYSTTDLLASWDASIILLLPVIVYPFLGLFLDKYGCRLWILIYGSAAFLITYLLLLAPPNMMHPFPPIFLFATAHAVVPLTGVTLVPLLTKHVSTGLGLHKSVDNIGATLSQTFAGLLLDAHLKKPNYSVDDGNNNNVGNDGDHVDDDLVVLRMFAVISGLGLIGCYAFWWFDKKYKGGFLNSKNNSIVNNSNNHHENDNNNKYEHIREEETSNGERILPMNLEEETNKTKIAASKMRKRTIIYMWIMGTLLCVCWIIFFVVSYEKAGVHASKSSSNEL